MNSTNSVRTILNRIPPHLLLVVTNMITALITILYKETQFVIIQIKNTTLQTVGGMGLLQGINYTWLAMIFFSFFVHYSLGKLLWWKRDTRVKKR